MTIKNFINLKTILRKNTAFGSVPFLCIHHNWSKNKTKESERLNSEKCLIHVVRAPAAGRRDRFISSRRTHTRAILLSRACTHVRTLPLPIPFFTGCGKKVAFR